MLDVGDVLTNFAHLSGSIALVVKLNDITQIDQMNVESETVHLLNSRNIRLVTFEYNVNSTQNIFERSTSLTGGTYFAANLTSYTSVITSAINKTIDLLNRDQRFLNRRVQVRIAIFHLDTLITLIIRIFSCFEIRLVRLLLYLSEVFTP